MEGQEACGKVSRVLECHDVLGSAFLLDHVRESLKRKGLLLGETATVSASAAAASVDVAHEKNNLQSIREEDARPFKERDIAWILDRKRNKQLCSLDFSAFCQVEVLTSSGIESLSVEGVRTGAIFGPPEKSCTAEKRRLEKVGCSTEIKTTAAGCGQSNPEAAADGAMDPLTPEIVQQTCRGRSPGSSADDTSSPEATDPGALWSNDRGVPLRPPFTANGASAMLAKETTIPNVSPSRGAQPRAQEHTTKQEVPANRTFTDKPTRKRKYLPKIRTENPRPRSRAKRVSVGSVHANLPSEIPETSNSPSLLRMKSFARINQRRPKLKRSRLGKAVAAANSDSRANCTPGCSVPPRPTADLADQDKITQSADFLRFLHESLFSDQATSLADRAASSCNGSFWTCTSHLAKEEEAAVDVDPSPAAEDPPSTRHGVPGPLEPKCWDFTLVRSPWSPPPTRRGVPVPLESTCRDFNLVRSPWSPPPTRRGVPVPLESTCRDFNLVRSPWSPPSPHESFCVVDPWNHFDDIIKSKDNFSAKSVRRALQFDAAPLFGDHMHLCQNSSQALAAAPDLDLLQVSAEASEFSWPQVVTMDREGPKRVNELQMVAYDEGSKRMMVYQRRVPRMRRVRLKPKVNLDARTLRMFKTLTIKVAGVGEAECKGEEETEDEKASWERSRQVWQRRAQHFISIMRQVQGNRSFSRWKGSVVDSVGGAFLTQNVSDFLSSNAFMSLRARFPARSREANTVETTPKAESPVEKQRSISTDPFLPCPAESPTPRKGDLNRQEKSPTRESPTCLHSIADCSSSACGQHSRSDLIRGWNEPCGTGENIAGKVSPCRQEAAAQAPGIFCTTMQSITDRTPCHLKSEEMAGVKELNSQSALTNAALELEALTMLRHTNQRKVSGSEELFFPLTSISIDSAPQQDMQPKCIVPPGTVVADGALGHFKRKCNRQSSKSSWEGKRAAPGVLQKKFASAVAAEKVSCLTAVGQEEDFNLVLIATLTLRLVLGMMPMKPEQLWLLLRDRLHKPNCKKMEALISPKQQMRPARALLRSSTDNYRYRRSVSFKLLAGEARASWEAGFVMKSQKAKWGPRRAAIVGDAHYRRDPWTADCVDWEAVHKASVHEVAQVIKNRGMNNALAGRMKAFLDRVHRDQDDGSIDLEWIRWLPPEEAKAFLLSFRGVGIKSVECIRLLTLHHPSFPVDTNVGRILVRLGWVPLEPLPEETQLHLLELYPVQSQIQQYAWPRLCTLDQKTLYELHYQMITFGKVFCTKSKPNCNACPMRTECKHYASSYASAKLLLKGREGQSEKQTTILALRGTEPAAESIIQQCCTWSGPLQPCVPIIEEPCSPEPSTGDRWIPDIEELPVDWDTGAAASGVETVDVVSIELSSSGTGAEVTEELCVNLGVQKTLSLDLNRNSEEDTHVLLPTTFRNVVKKGVERKAIATGPYNETRGAVELDGEELHGGVPEDFKHLPSRELILLPPQESIAPAPKLKSIQRLRTVHFVYELPDNHPLLFEMDKREADDPCFYLLAIWSPDEVPAIMPKIHDDESTNPFASCEEDCDRDPAQTTVRGTLLIPCKTAMRGWFPLNGTYFQVNEVFADHASSVQPIDVPRTLLWSLRRRFVYFSTAVSNLFKDMSQDEIQCCFQKGYVCLRAFDVATREPRILASRLHQSGAKIVQARTPRKRQQRKIPST